MRTLIVMLIGLSLVTFFGCGGNDAPVIEQVATSKTEVEPGGVVAINVIASDQDGDEITYVYEVSAGEIEGSGSIVTWKAPEEEGIQFIKVTVKDEENWDQESVTIEVIAEEG